MRINLPLINSFDSDMRASAIKLTRRTGNANGPIK